MLGNNHERNHRLPDQNECCRSLYDNTSVNIISCFLIRQCESEIISDDINLFDKVNGDTCNQIEHCDNNNVVKHPLWVIFSVCDVNYWIDIRPCTVST